MDPRPGRCTSATPVGRPSSPPVGFVILPRYVAGAATEPAPAPRSTALPRLLEQSFSLRNHGARGIGVVTALLQAADCYTLTVGSLDAAIQLLTRLTDE